MADGVKGDVGIPLPPYEARKKKNKQTMKCHHALVQIRVDLLSLLPAVYGHKYIFFTDLEDYLVTRQ